MGSHVRSPWLRWPGRSGLGARGRAMPEGVRGTARIGRRPEALLRRVGTGDVAVLDQVDLDRSTAHALVDAGVVGVVNVSPSISGRYPNLGPEILTHAGVTLVDDVGDGVLRAVREGAAVRLHDGGIYLGEREVARGFAQTADSVAAQLDEARSGLSAQLEAFSANTMEFMARERAMLLDGVGVPGLETAVHGRHALVVAAGPDRAATAAEIGRLRHYVRDHRPVLIGVGAGAEILHRAGHVPAVVVGTAPELDLDVARRATDVVLPADPDGHVAGLPRLQDAGIDPVAFVSTANPEDMALLLARTHGASLVVTVGFDATLGDFLDRGRSGSNPSTFLTRLRLGPDLVDSSAVLALARRRTPVTALVVLLAAVVAVAAALLLTGVGEALVGLAGEALAGLLDLVRGARA